MFRATCFVELYKTSPSVTPSVIFLLHVKKVIAALLLSLRDGVEFDSMFILRATLAATEALRDMFLSGRATQDNYPSTFGTILLLLK